MAKLEELGFVPRRSKRLRSKNPPLAETIPSSPSSSCSFMTDVNDDVLTEILLRLPDAPFAAQSGLVSKRWSSLISSHEFRTKFNQNHRHHHSLYDLQPSYYLPYTLLFTFVDRQIDDITFTSHKLSSNAMSGIHYHRPNSAGYLDFLPEICPRKKVEISSGDLVLSSNDEQYCVSNPLTKEWNVLPKENMPPLPTSIMAGLWLDPNHYASDRRLGEYKVLLLDQDPGKYFDLVGDHFRFRVLMFSSESGEWSERSFRAPKKSSAVGAARGVSINAGAVQIKGVVYFPMTSDGSAFVGFLALDPRGSGECCRVVRVPKDFGYGRKTELFFQVGFGAVRGRLRLWQFCKNSEGFDLKVWELLDENENETAWVLVHGVSVNRGFRIDMAMSVVAFDPIDGDVVFMVLSSFIFRYNMRRDKYEKVGQLPNTKSKPPLREYILWKFLIVHTVVHNSWRLLPI